MELERDDLKGLVRFTKKSELQSKIDRYDYQNVQEFYQIYHKSYSAYIAYKEQIAEWEKTYGEDNQKQNKESVLERLKNPPKRTTDYQQQKTSKGKDRGAE